MCLFEGWRARVAELPEPLFVDVDELACLLDVNLNVSATGRLDGDGGQHVEPRVVWNICTGR